jgi:hypothetical protein
MVFKQATKKDSKLRLGLVGPAGSGKTFTALTVAKHFGGRVAVIDSEHGSASKYADLFNFDVLELDSFSPQNYVAAIKEAEKAGYDILVIDSLSHAWAGKDGALEQVDKAAARSKSGNSFAAWREVTPMHNAMVDAIMGAKLHVIATLRSKSEYVLEANDRGKKVPRKVGMAPIQRDGLEYEFDIVGDLNWENRLIVTKTRCPELAGAVIHKPGQEFAEVMKQWLSGTPSPENPEPTKEPEEVAPSTAPQPPPFPIKQEQEQLIHVHFLDQCEVIAGMGPRVDVEKWACDLTKAESYEAIPGEYLLRLLDGGVRIKPEAALASFNAYQARARRAS